VAAGQVDIAISYEPEVMLARDDGLDVVAVAALVHGPLTSLISLPEGGIEEPSDLAGKTVVTAGIPYQTVYLDSILRGAGVDPAEVEQVDVGLNLLQPLVAGRADAMLGGFANVEGVDLAERGLDPRVVPVDELGIPTYDELVLVTSGERMREDPGSIAAFIAALERGTEAAAKDPQAATEALLAADPALDPELTRAQVDATLPRLAAEKGEPFGSMDPAAWERFGAFLADNGQVEVRPAAGEILTNELLPGKLGD
jgi:putative hydroxymethylpyrimidine transport system substrate-binding protein